MLVFYGVASLFGTPLAGMFVNNKMAKSIFKEVIVSFLFYLKKKNLYFKKKEENKNIFESIVILTGLLYDTLGDYHGSFYLAGSCVLLSAFICYPLGRINRWEKEKNRRTSKK